VSGTPGERTSATKLFHSAFARSTTGRPAVRACSTACPLSSQAATLAPPAMSAAAVTRPLPPRPKTATFLPEKAATGIIWPSFRRRREAMDCELGEPGEGHWPFPERDRPPCPLAGRSSGSRPLPIGERSPARSGGAQICGGASSDLEARQAEERQHHRDDPEADHDLRLGPAERLEVVVDRRHLEDAPAGQLEGDDLDDDR